MQKTKIRSWWTVKELRPDSDSVLLYKRIIERLEVHTTKMSKRESFCDYRVVKSISLLGAIVKRRCEIFPASAAMVFTPHMDFMKELSPMPANVNIDVIFQMPSPLELKALEQMAEVVDSYHRECSISGVRVGDEVDPIKQMQAQSQVG